MCLAGGTLALTMVAPCADAGGAEFKSLYSFGAGTNDGANPESGLVPDGLDGFYGTTTNGGNADGGCDGGCGTIFDITRTGSETIIYAFPYGTNGAFPIAGLTQQRDGSYVGTTQNGGAYGEGMVFELTPYDAELVLYSFRGGRDGAAPRAGLIADKAGNLYGTTSDGGGKGCYDHYGCGTVFELSPDGEETVLHSFSAGRDGNFPWAGLLLDKEGNLYGTTVYGGAQNCGTVFKLTPQGAETVLHAFKGGSDGCNPYYAPIADDQGNLYGTTFFGGAEGCEDGCGTVFKISPEGAETVLYAFQGGEDGDLPFSGVIADKSGNLYGTTSQGAGTGCDAHEGCGMIFKLTRDGSEILLHTFVGSDGAYPEGGLLLDKNGNLYGTTNGGGANGYGTVFELKS